MSTSIIAAMIARLRHLWSRPCADPPATAPEPVLQPAEQQAASWYEIMSFYIPATRDEHIRIALTMLSEGRSVAEIAAGLHTEKGAILSTSGLYKRLSRHAATTGETT